MYYTVSLLADKAKCDQQKTSKICAQGAPFLVNFPTCFCTPTLTVTSTVCSFLPRKTGINYFVPFVFVSVKKKRNCFLKKPLKMYYERHKEIVPLTLQDKI